MGRHDDHRVERNDGAGDHDRLRVGPAVQEVGLEQRTGDEDGRVRGDRGRREARPPDSVPPGDDGEERPHRDVRRDLDCARPGRVGLDEGVVPRDEVLDDEGDDDGPDRDGDDAVRREDDGLERPAEETQGQPDPVVDLPGPQIDRCRDEKSDDQYADRGVGDVDEVHRRAGRSDAPATYLNRVKLARSPHLRTHGRVQAGHLRPGDVGTPAPSGTPSRPVSSGSASGRRSEASCSASPATRSPSAAAPTRADSRSGRTSRGPARPACSWAKGSGSTRRGTGCGSDGRSGGTRSARTPFR